MPAGPRRAALVLGIVAVVASLVGIAVAGTSRRGVVVGIRSIELDLYSVNLTGAVLLGFIGVLALVGAWSPSTLPLWIASGVSALLVVYGFAVWRDDTRNPVGFDGRTMSLLLGLSVSFGALAWATNHPVVSPD